MNGLLKGQSSGYDGLTILERPCQHLLAALDMQELRKSTEDLRGNQHHGLYWQDLATEHHFRCP